MKSKLTWKFPQTIFTVTVLPSELARVHQETPRPIVLHNCLEGISEQGTHVKTLYCTRSGRFFARNADGWSEQLPCTNRARAIQEGRPVCKAAGGIIDSPFMQNFGNLMCHRLVAYAWCKHPEAEKNDPEWYKRGHGFEVDHLNTDHKNWTANNLQWVTTKENVRRAKILRRLRKMAIDPKWVCIPHLNALYSFEECQLEYFFELLPDAIAKDKRELSLENVNDVISSCIDNVIRHTIRCSRCGRKMIEGTGEHNTHNSILCDCCFTDLYGYF